MSSAHTVSTLASVALAARPVTTAKPRYLVWFRSDLRLHDNPVLSKISALPGPKEVIPVYCFDPRQYAKDAPHTFGCAKTGVRRAEFLRQSVADLRTQLRACGSDLLVGHGKPEELLPQLIQSADAGPTTVVCQEQICSEELAVDRALLRALKKPTKTSTPRCELKTIWSGTLLEDVDVKTLYGSDLSSLPDVFTPFRNKVEAKCDVPCPLAAPKRDSLPLPSDLATAAAPGLGFDSMPSLAECAHRRTPDCSPDFPFVACLPWPTAARTDTHTLPGVCAPGRAQLPPCA